MSAWRGRVGLLVPIICLNPLLCGAAVPVEYHWGAKAYHAAASSQEGDRAVRDSHIEYVCEDTFGMVWTDLYRGNCFFAADVKHERGTLSFYKVDAADVRNLGLRPDLGFWDRFGRWILGLALLALVVAGIRSARDRPAGPPVRDERAEAAIRAARKESAASDLKSPLIYNVTADKSPVTMPPACACCLAPPSTKIPVYSRSWAGIDLQNLIQVPYCDECVSHSRERGMRMLAIGALSAIIATVLVITLDLAAVSKSHDAGQFAIVSGFFGAAFGIGAAWALARGMRAKALDKCHASPGIAVKFKMGWTKAKLSFWHPAVAAMFAELNGATVVSSPAKRMSRGSYLLAGPARGQMFGWIGGLCLLFGAIAGGTVGLARENAMAGPVASSASGDAAGTSTTQQDPSVESQGEEAVPQAGAAQSGAAGTAVATE